MSLVRCSCIASFVWTDGALALDVHVADPDCNYVLHRLEAGE